MIFLRDKEEEKYYITADLHLGHHLEAVWKTRGFNDHVEHVDGLISTINSTVRPQDILVVIGDICLNSPMDKLDDYLDRIACQNVWMLWGNHNNPHEKQVYRRILRERGFSDEEQLYPVRYKNLVFHGYYMEAAINGNFACLMHYPIAVFNEMKRGSWMLCGHSHYGYPPSTAEHLDNKILDVGWEGHGRPWSLPEIKEVMDAKGKARQDKHH